MQAVATAQQSGDVAKIAAANRSLIAVALRAMAELKLAAGRHRARPSTSTSNRSNSRTRPTRTSLWRSPTCARNAPTTRWPKSSPVTKSDPKNADAWNVQGKLLMDKKQYRPAAEALTSLARVAEQRDGRLRAGHGVSESAREPTRPPPFSSGSAMPPETAPACTSWPAAPIRTPA